MDGLATLISLMLAKLPTELADAAAAGKFIAIVVASAVRRARQMADEAAAALSAAGLNVADISPFDAMAFAARMTLEKYCTLGFLRRSNFEAPHGKRLRSEIKNGADIQDLEARRKEAFFLDVTLFLERHFSPTRAMLNRLHETGALGDDPVQEYLTLRPFSEEGNKALQSFDKLNFTNLKVRPFVREPVSMNDLLQEIRLTEAEAARIARKALKTLADKRRDKLIPDSLYVQDAEDGAVFYDTKKWLAYVAGETFGKQQMRRSKK